MVNCVLNKVYIKGTGCFGYENILYLLSIIDLFQVSTLKFQGSQIKGSQKVSFSYPLTQVERKKELR